MLPGVLGAENLKPWNASPVQVLAQRDPVQAAIPGVSQEELSWLPWAKAIIGSQSPGTWRPGKGAGKKKITRSR